MRIASRGRRQKASAGIALALTLTQAQPPSSLREAPKTDQTVPVQRGSRLTISNFAGEVIVHTWDKDSIHVVARHQSRTRVDVHSSPSLVEIGATGTRGPQGSVDYDVTAPAWMSIKVEGTYNFITLDGVQGEVSANTVRGDVIIKGGVARSPPSPSKAKCRWMARGARSPSAPSTRRSVSPTRAARLQRNRSTAGSR